jgi:hypothetical protein
MYKDNKCTEEIPGISHEDATLYTWNTSLLVKKSSE